MTYLSVSKANGAVINMPNWLAVLCEKCGLTQKAKPDKNDLVLAKVLEQLELSQKLREAQLQKQEQILAEMKALKAVLDEKTNTGNYKYKQRSEVMEAILKRIEDN